MIREGDGFEREVRNDLQDLARGAPAGPAPGEISHRLRRRAVGRVVRRSGLAACLALALGLAWISREPPRPGDRAVPLLTAGTRPTPIPADADREVVEESISRYLEYVGSEAGYIEKRPNEGASFSLRGRVGVLNEELRRDLNSLLENFDQANLTYREGKVRYSFARWAR